MGAGASAQEASKQASSSSAPKVRPTRETATASSFSLVADIIRHGIDATSIVVVAARPAAAQVEDLNTAGVLWGSPDGLHCGKQKLVRAQATIPWDEPGLKFSSHANALVIASDARRWTVKVKRKASIASWLACYLNAFLPILPAEYTVSFEEWGRLGIAFAVYADVVIPVVFTVDEPALSLGVVPASVLVSLNGTRIVDLPMDTNMLDFISNAEFPKTCTFSRPSHAMTRLQERRTRIS